MKKLRGFTLIELLIVVAIIAILAAIAVPNFLEAQVRSKVSRVKSDQRSLATAIESYYVDNNVYPAMTLTLNESADSALIASGNSAGRTFQLRNSQAPDLSTLTTPIAYVTSYFVDPFADTRGLTFRYFRDNQGWILGSWGPDTDQAAGGDLQWNNGDITVPADGDGTNLVRETGEAGVESVYISSVSQPSTVLLAGEGSGTGIGAYTYDPTNGTVSQGDVWRVKE
ncbi:type II secretion system protein GspG [bacterium]|nr:type II secretion system protein GspG [bacterium]